MTALPLLLSAALSAAPCPPAAARCSCIPPRPPGEALAQADAVFAGRVVSVTERREEDPGHPGGPYLEVRIVPGRRWKGAAADTVTVRTADNSAACGYAFETGGEYLVYAAGEDALRVNLCSRTRPLADAGEDLAALGAPAVTRIPVRKEIP
ncbi:MAG: hypothetical protein AB1941_24720 [Gemmatimonadota bacterium]